MRTVEEMTSFIELYEKEDFSRKQGFLKCIVSELLPDERIVWAYYLTDTAYVLAFSQYRLFVCERIIKSGLLRDVENFDLHTYDIKDMESIDVTKSKDIMGFHCYFKISMKGMNQKRYDFYAIKNENKIDRLKEDVDYVLAHSKLHGGQDDVEALKEHFGSSKIKEYNTKKEEYNNKILEPLLRNAISYECGEKSHLDLCLRELYPDEDVYLVLFVRCFKRNSGSACIIATNQRLIIEGEAYRDIIVDTVEVPSHYSIKYSEIVKIGNKLATINDPAHVIMITTQGDIHLYPGKDCIRDLIAKLSSVVDQAKNNPTALKPIIKASDISFPDFGASETASEPLIRKKTRSGGTA